MRRSLPKLALGRGKQRLLALSTAATAAGLLAAPGANAAFTTQQCQGADIIGRGATFAAGAHQNWILEFGQSFCPGRPAVDYQAQGSGAGRRVVGERSGTNADGSQARNQPPRFGMTDEPPKPAGQAQMNQGTDAAGDEGTIHVIPAAAGPVTMIVNWPDNCDKNLLAADNRATPDNDDASDFTIRPRLDRTEFEAVWNGDTAADNWNEVFPELAADADCNKAIKRVVRQDDSGTSFAFKDYLDKLNPSRGWLTTFVTPNTLTWPNNATNPVLNGGAAGNGPLSDKVNTEDGSIGYGDLSTVRSKGFQMTPCTATVALCTDGNPANQERDDDRFWVPAQNSNATPANRWAEPTADANSFKNGAKGGNCASTTFRNVPGGADPTLGNWEPVSGVDPPSGYPVCTLTYGLVFDDNATAYGNNATEEAKARSVKDYWAFIVSATGQATLFPGDYSALATVDPDGAGPQKSIRQIAIDGVNAIGWNKAGDAGGGTGGGGSGTSTNTSTSTNTQSPATNAIAARPAISNLFSISSIAVGRNGSLVASLRVPGAGRVRGLATAKIANKRAKKGKKPTKGKKEKTREITVGSTTVNPTQGGSVRVPIRLTKVAAAALKSRRKLSVSIAFTYTPAGGQARTLKRSVNLKAAKQKSSKKG